MNDAIKIIIGGQIRQWVLLLAGAALSHHFLSQETVDYITATPALTWFAAAAALGVAARGLYVRLRSKTAQKLALGLPQGTSMGELKQQVAQQPLRAVLSASPQ